jgi:uncharacterized surface protein with fasciclin (FAS1) repeats
MAADGRFTTFRSLLRQTGLEDTLTGPGPFTIFAPTDDYFAQLPEGGMELLTSDLTLLTEILRLHIVPDEIYKADMSGGCDAVNEWVTLSGQSVMFNKDPEADEKSVEGIQFVVTNLRADNGLVHGIETLLKQPQDEELWLQGIGRYITFHLPDEIAGETVERTFRSYWPIGSTSYNDYRDSYRECIPKGALRTTLLYGGSGPFTVFIPTDAALARLDAELGSPVDDYVSLSELLYYHVIEGTAVDLHSSLPPTTFPTLLGEDLAISSNGRTVQLNGTPINIIAERQAIDGNLYVIDTAVPPPDREWLALPNLQEAAVSSGQLHTFIRWWQDADFERVAQQWGPFTIFAPTDAAFIALQSNDTDRLRLDLIEPKAFIFPYTVEGRLSMDDLRRMDSVNTLDFGLGKTVPISVNENQLFFGEARIIASIEAANGIIYLIDQVALPAE